jgi:rare lipoprotein A
MSTLLGARGRRLLAFGLVAALLTFAISIAEADAQTPAEATTENQTTVRASAREHVLAGTNAPVKGRISTGESGRKVAVQVRGAGRGWTTVVRTKTRKGSFSATWRPSRTGRYAVRVLVAGASDRVDGPVTVYRAARASWYGPGFYGRRTACGQKMTRSLVGVAHKRLPCGTQVALLYRGRTITVPVVDRGPFRPGTRWDLTSATAEALGFEHTDRVGAVRIR